MLRFQSFDTGILKDFQRLYNTIIVFYAALWTACHDHISMCTFYGPQICSTIAQWSRIQCTKLCGFCT